MEGKEIESLVGGIVGAAGGDDTSATAVNSPMRQNAMEKYKELLKDVSKW